MAKKKYYAVKSGLCPGIYFTWDDCKKQVHGCPNAIYKSFESIQEATLFMEGGKGLSTEVEPSKNAENEEKPMPKAGEGIAYVDGSYNQNTGEYGIGVALFYKDQEEHIVESGKEESLAAMRNVAGEILGATRAMERSIELGLKRVVIYHDYQGISSWCLGEWKTNKEGTKAYKAYFDSISDTIQVEFVKVKGHSSNKWNDLADELAKSAIF